MHIINIKYENKDKKPASQNTTIRNNVSMAKLLLF